MGNCLFNKNSNINNSNIENYENAGKETTPLLNKKKNLPNIDILTKIYNKKICALCEKKSKTLKSINNDNEAHLENIVFCLDCRKKLGYYCND